MRPVCSLAVLALVLLALPARAGRDPVYAIVGAKIVPVSGPVIEKGTLVMRGGTIEAIGASVTAPPDARVIDGTGLVLTPGLIDAFGGVGLPVAKKGGAREAPKAEALAPHKLSLERVEPGEALKARDAGVTTALVIPQDGILPGQSVLLDLVGESAEGMAVAQPLALHVHMTTQGRKYRDSLMGTVALARQALLNATRYRDEWAVYRQAPAGW